MYIIYIYMLTLMNMYDAYVNRTRQYHAIEYLGDECNVVVIRDPPRICPAVCWGFFGLFDLPFLSPGRGVQLLDWHMCFVSCNDAYLLMYIVYTVIIRVHSYMHAASICLLASNTSNLWCCSCNLKCIIVVETCHTQPCVSTTIPPIR